MSEPARVVCLPGDGIGPEVMAVAVEVLRTLPLDLELSERDFGGVAIDRHGVPLPQATLDACLEADAVLLAAVGAPGYDAKPVRPEQGLIGIRKELDVYANLRPARSEGVDLLIVRELVGGLYYGARGRRDDGSAYDTCEYSPAQIERIARRAFELAQSRSGRLLSVDKANVLETSRLWREVVTSLGAEYPDVELSHALVDSTAMRIVTDPDDFDVLLMENTFGDILSDVAAAVTGGLGLAGSASIGDHNPGLFEPVHGSAPDIVGLGIANPAGILRSVALMLDLALGEPELATSVDAAVDAAIAATPTRDLGGTASTTEFGAAVLSALPTTTKERERWKTPAS
jgi:3-isopropylmalate dehydrogenase